MSILARYVAFLDSIDPSCLPPNSACRGSNALCTGSLAIGEGYTSGRWDHPTKAADLAVMAVVLANSGSLPQAHKPYRLLAASSSRLRLRSCPRTSSRAAPGRSFERVLTRLRIRVRHAPVPVSPLGHRDQPPPRHDQEYSAEVYIGFDRGEYLRVCECSCIRSSSLVGSIVSSRC